jgi:hypothetical protein
VALAVGFSDKFPAKVFLKFPLIEQQIFVGEDKISACLRENLYLR